MVGLPPDFLWGLVESRNFMRLSLQKAAQASMGGAAYRKSGSPRLFRPRYPGFPVEVGGVAELHAAFLNESRTRGPVWCSVTGNPGTLGRTWGTLSLLGWRRWGKPQQVQISHPEAGPPRDHGRPGGGAAPLCAASPWPRWTTWEQLQGLRQLRSPAPTPVPVCCRCCLAPRLRG
jgi:hypothetical protein